MIRTLNADDAERIFSIISRHSVSGLVGAPKWTLEQVREEAKGGGLVSEAPGGHLNAFILFRESPDAWEITYLATAPDALRRGTMRTLLAELIRRRPAGLPLWLEVHDGNLPARDLYERAGFEVVGKRPGYYADGRSAVLYSLRD